MWHSVDARQLIRGRILGCLGKLSFNLLLICTRHGVSYVTQLHRLSLPFQPVPNYTDWWQNRVCVCDYVHAFVGDKSNIVARQTHNILNASLIRICYITTLVNNNYYCAAGTRDSWRPAPLSSPWKPFFLSTKIITVWFIGPRFGLSLTKTKRFSWIFSRSLARHPDGPQAPKLYVGL